jgi:hypothetical protein
MVKKIENQDFIEVRQVVREFRREKSVVGEVRGSLERARELTQSSVWWIYAWRISSYINILD